jgi:hypothetical protein
MIDNSGGSEWMSESVTHSRLSALHPLITSPGGTTPIVSRILAQSIRSFPGLMERRRAKPIICSVLIGKQLAH